MSKFKLIATIEVTVDQMPEKKYRRDNPGFKYPDKNGIVDEVRTMLIDRIEGDEYCIIDWPSYGGTSVACQGISVIAVGMKG